MKHLITSAVATTALLALAAGPATAQIDIDWFTIDGGGGASSAGSLELSGTIGQFDAADSSGGTLSLRGGFNDLESANGGSIARLRVSAGVGRILLSWRGATSNANGITGYVVDRQTAGGGAATTRIATLNVNANGRYAVRDASAAAGPRYTYIISERYGTLTLPRASIDGRSVDGTNLPSTVARVGAAGGFSSIQAALAAAPSGTGFYTVFVEAGTYPAFQIDGSAPDRLRILADATGGPVVIDTSSAALRIQNRAVTQTTELHGLQIGTPSSPGVGLIVDSAFGPVILDQLEVHSSSGVAAVDLLSSFAVALQTCSLDGSPGLRMSGARASAGRTSTTGSRLDNASTLTTVAWSSSAADQLLGGSTINALPGVMPNIETPLYLLGGIPLVVDIEAGSAQTYGLFLAFDHFYAELPGFDMPLLLDPTPLLQLVVGSTDAGGDAVESLLFSSYPPELLGQGLPLQAITLNPQSGSIRFSNATTTLSPM